MLLGALSFIFLILHISDRGGFPPTLTPEEERQWLDRLGKGDPEARTVLIERNLRLVAHIVKKYYSGSEEQDDLVSIGTVGLIKAVDSFDTTKKVRIGTYAARCIRNEILMYFRSRKKAASEVSLNEEIETDREGNPLSLTDVLPADTKTEEDIIEKISAEGRRRALSEAVSEKLDSREREIISLRYGIGCTPLTQKETAEKLGISRSYVSRLEKAAVEKLREAMKDYR